MCVNSLSQGLNVDLPKAGLEPLIYGPRAERLPLDHDATKKLDRYYHKQLTNSKRFFRKKYTVAYADVLPQNIDVVKFRRYLKYKPMSIKLNEQNYIEMDAHGKASIKSEPAEDVHRRKQLSTAKLQNVWIRDDKLK
ncbi:hypothetical protein ElyMa_002304900 [Elysia marginata]|uniref:Uncharacterized protein n=1 Tax=Elysia marginata TaxID=1093978 RepID=A0AAV4G3F2_9GAST|nr:hypothetical protein ElyMa_002304900 [Elysia marginata]